MNNSGETTTYKVTKETLLKFDGSGNNLAYFDSTTNQITGSFITHISNNGNTLGIGTSAFDSSQPERLIVAQNNSTNIATFQTAKQDSYAEVNIKNFGSGSNSSSDLVLWNDVSTESSSYVDLGINSSNYSAGQVGYGGDGYLYNATNDMYVGSTGIGNHGHLHLFGGNMWTSSSISIYNDGTIGFGTDVLDNNANTIPSSGFTYEFRGNTKFDNNVKVDGSINLTSGSITMPNRPAFRVTGAGGAKSATNVISGSYMIADYSQGSGWNQSTGTFTAPIAGLYQVNLVCRTNSNTYTGSTQVIVYKNNTTLSPTNGSAQIMLEWAANTTVNHIGGSTITKLAVGDTLKAVVTVGTISFDENDNFSVAYIG
jgi:hypothetical protein